MGNSISSNWMKFYDENILAFFQSLKDNPFSLFTAILDLAIVIFLLYAFFSFVVLAAVFLAAAFFTVFKSLAINKRNCISNNCNLGKWIT